MFFDSFGMAELKHFIVQDDKKIINKVLKEIEIKIDQTLALQKLKFSMSGYDGLKKSKIISLSETARDFFHLLESFGKNKNVIKFVNVWLLKNPIQKIETSTCGPFQFYFYENLF